jgi:flagellum-specific peptidoglycan hydrolase FlgJ
MLSAAQLSALGLAAASAVASEKTTKLPAELTVPQWALESGWGEHAPGNNCFGIKATTGTASQTLSTQEVPHPNAQPVTEEQQFEVFPTLQACFDRHAALITSAQPYAAAWAQYLKDGDKAMLMQRIAPRYAPNNLLYSTKLARILQMSEVRGAIAQARKPLVNIT